MYWKQKEEKEPEVSIKSNQTFMTTPENQFAHAAGLLASQGHGIEMNSDISELLDQSCFLGLQNNDMMIRFWQVDSLFITSMFNMAQQDSSQELFEVFKFLFTAFKFEIRLTGNKDGLERKLQHSFGGAGMNAAQIGSMLQSMRQLQGENYADQEGKKGLFS